LIFFLCAGTVIDNKICHPRNYDFYMCAHAGMIVSIQTFLFNFYFIITTFNVVLWVWICRRDVQFVVMFLSQLPWTCLIILKQIQGTSRPTHYHVLLDEIGFSADDLQELVHSLSYV